MRKAKDYVTGTALAEHVGCTRQTIYNYVSTGIIERGKDGKFDQDRCRGQILRHLRNQATVQIGNSGDNLASARTELAKVQREAIEWKNRKAKGDFVRAEAVVQLLTQDFATNRREVRSLATRLPSKLLGQTAAAMEAALESEVYEILTKLADPGTYPPI